MKKSNLFLVLFLAFLAFLAWYLPKHFNSFVFHQEGNLIENPLVGIKASQITKIVIKKVKDQSFALEQNNGQWWLELEGKKQPANSKLVQNMIQAYAQPQKLTIVSTNKDYRSRFDLTGQNSQEIIFFTPKEIKVALGKISQDYQSTYVAFSQDGPVVLFPADRLRLLPSDCRLYNPYYDLDLNLDQLTKIEINQNNKTLLIEKNKDEWLYNNQKLDKAKLDTWLTNLTNQKGQAGQIKDNSWLDKPVVVMRFVKTDKQEAKIEVVGTNKQLGLQRTKVWSGYVWPLHESQTKVYKPDPNEWLAESKND